MVRRMAAVCAGAVMAWCLGALLLSTLVDGLGTSPRMMLALMRRYAPPEATGLPEAEYPGMAAMITGYLAGAREEFQYTWTGEDGAVYQAFGERERQHMADCLTLFQLCRGVRLAGAAGLMASAVAAWLLGMRRRAATGFLLGGGLLLGLLLALGLWAAVDFDGAFVFFHQVSFSNGLWLLDPRRELLIRLMPTGFFMAYAAVLALTFMALMALGMACAALARRPKERMG